MSRSQPFATRLNDMASSDRPFLRFWSKGQRRDISHADFWQQVDRLCMLADVRSKPGTIDLVGNTSPDLMALFVALIALGRTPSFFPPNAPLQDHRAYFEQQRRALARIDCGAIFTDNAAVAETIAEIDPSLATRVQLVHASGSDIAGEGKRAARAFEMRLASNDVVFVQHSSGTTGIKKGVGVTGRALLAQHAAYWPTVASLGGGDPLAIASWLPIYHDMGLLTGFILPLIGGDCVSLVDPFEWIKRPSSLFEMIAADECSLCWLPNFAFRHLARCKPLMSRAELSTMRAWINCSEPCRVDDVRFFEDSFAAWGVRAGTVRGCYAMAETVFAVTQAIGCERLGLVAQGALEKGADLRVGGAVLVTDPPSVAGATLSSGRTIDGHEVRIAHSGTTLPEWHYGEVEVRGASLFTSYRGVSPAESGLTAEGWYKTGDLGLLIEGELFVLGRGNDVIIVNGKNLHAADIEDAVQSVAGVKPGRVVAFGLYNEGVGSEQLVIVAEADVEATAPSREIAAGINACISTSFLVAPREVHVVAERWLVKTTSGKLSRVANREKYAALLAGGTPKKDDLRPIVTSNRGVPEAVETHVATSARP